MKVTLLSPGQDTGGQGARTARAFERFAPEWDVRSVHASDTYIRFPIDLRWKPALVEELYRASDVVHWKNGLSLYAQLDGGQRKPTVVQHHGTRLRTNPEKVWREAQSVGALQMVSTVDLLACAPGSVWMPSPFDLDALARHRSERPRERPRIVHSPTNRAVKGTDMLLAACSALTARGLDFDLDITEGVQWTACLARKGRADIYVDQLVLGYGGNAVEAWAMGLPVVCGVADPAVKATMLQTWGELPFIEATPETLEGVLEALLVDAALRAEWADRGRAHAWRWHDHRYVVERLRELYTEAAKHRSGGPAKLRLADPQAGIRPGLLRGAA